MAALQERKMSNIFRVGYFALIIAATATAAPQMELEAPSMKPHYELDDAPALFEKFIQDYNKTYKDEADKQVHYDAFRNTLKDLNELNSDPNQGSATFDINDFSDFTEEERKKMRGGFIIPEA